MSFDAHKNFALSTVATAPSPATTGTSVVVMAGTGTKFPAAPFNATVWPSGSAPTTANAEIVRVTQVVGDTLTIARAQEGTTARTVLIGDNIGATITAKSLTDIEASVSGVGIHVEATIVAARAVPTTGVTPKLCITLGKAAAFDNGGKVYGWNATSTETDNDISILKPNDVAEMESGRWEQLI